jgi:hypothetical protein
MCHVFEMSNCTPYSVKLIVIAVVAMVLACPVAGKVTMAVSPTKNKIPLSC